MAPDPCATAAPCPHCGYRNDLAEEVADTRHAVLRILDIMEADKLRSMRAAGIVGAVAFSWLVAMIVMAVRGG